MMRQSRKDSFWMWGVGIAVLVVGAGAAVYMYQRNRAPETEAVVETPPPAAPTQPEPRPIPVAPPAPVERSVPLPPLDESDADVQGGLTELVGRDAITQFLVPERIVRNIVVTIDNLPREKTALQQRPIKSTPGEFIVGGTEEARVLAPENYGRYKPFVSVAQNVDAKTLVALYRGLQPLFQQAYEDLGHPNGFFNTRLLEVIEHLLATPEVRQPIQLVQPSVFFRYADPKLEELSTGQKLLIRMGPENAGIIKAKLREIQAELS
jgi:Protein of unknown function (DUF3014)